MKMYLRTFLIGLAGFAGLLAFYFILMSVLTGSWDAAWSQFEKLWFYMIPLSIGFGLQVGLYSHLRRLIRNNTGENVMMVNTTTSAIGMVACCAHHLTDVLPLIGLTAFSVLLITYQTPLLILGILSNILGIYYLLHQIKLHKSSS